MAAVAPLYPPVQRLALCQTVAAVGGVAIDGMRTAFGSHAGAAFFFDQASRTAERASFGARDADIDEYERDWSRMDLVGSAVLDRGVPVHNWEVYCESALPLLYTEFGRRFDLYHYVSAPLFGTRGNVVGLMNICRRARQRPFSSAEVRLAAAFAGFISAALVRVQNDRSSAPQNVLPGTLTPREWQVARMAAAGRNNLEIALQLGLARETVKQTLRRVFRKVEVNGRVQMAAKLAAHGLL